MRHIRMRLGSALMAFVLVMSVSMTSVFAASPSKTCTLPDYTGVTAEHNAYWKIKNKKNLNILVIGDSISNNAGASSAKNGFQNVFARNLKSTYGIKKVNVKNVSYSGNTTYCGIVNAFMASTNGVEYDIALLTFCANDKKSIFGRDFEQLIRVVQTRYPNIVIIPVLEAWNKNYKDSRIKKIIKLSKHYNLAYADAIKVFNNSGCKRSKLIKKDGYHATNLGHKLYAKALMNVVEAQIEAQNFTPKEMPDMMYSVPTYTTLACYGKGKATKKGCAYTFKINKSGYYGVHYTTLAKSRTVFTVYLDGKKIFTKSYKSDVSHNNIGFVPITFNKISPKSKIKIVFNTSRAARKFKGLMVGY